MNYRSGRHSIKWLLLGWGCCNSVVLRSTTWDHLASIAALKSLGNKDHIKSPVRIFELLYAEVRCLWPCQAGLCIWMLASHQNIVFNNSALSVDKDVPFAFDNISLEIMDSYHIFKYKYVVIEIQPEIRWRLKQLNKSIERKNLTMKLCPSIPSLEFYGNYV